jgi:sec-independent protein translocase protein TatA
MPFSHGSLGLSTSGGLGSASPRLPCNFGKRIFILLIILLLFGAKKLPELARGMGQAVKEFQKSKDEFNDELHKAGKSETATAKSDVKPAELTVPRSENPSSTAMRPDPNQAVTPGDKADQV